MEKKQRESGIEILKILAIFIIVIFHVTMTLGKQEYTGGYKTATRDIQHFVLSLFYYLGPLGNNIFFIASAWFLSESKSAKIQKVLQMLLDVWVISVFFLAVFVCCGFTIKGVDVIYSLFPTIFSNNWYVTDYMIFYLIHPYLNMVFEKISREEHFKANCVSAFLFLFLNMIRHDLLESTGLVTFIVIYSIVTYIKKYRMDYAQSRTQNVHGLLIGFFGLIGLVLLTNIIGLYNGFIGEQMLHWAKNTNPLIILLAFSLFNLFRRNNLKNAIVNGVGSVTLIIYLTHENLLVREYLRPVIWSKLYDIYGLHHLVAQVLIFAVVLFSLTLLIGLVYKYSLQRLTERLSIAISKRLRSNSGREEK